MRKGNEQLTGFYPVSKLKKCVFGTLLHKTHITSFSRSVKTCALYKSITVSFTASVCLSSKIDAPNTDESCQIAALLPVPDV